jgi:hypothetical protein
MRFVNWVRGWALWEILLGVFIVISMILTVIWHAITGKDYDI